MNTAIPSGHVRCTRNYLESELQLDRLLALTEGLAAPGGSAFDLVAPLLSGDRRIQWAQLSGLGLRPERMLEMALCVEQAFERLQPWSTAGIQQLCASVAASFGTSESVVRSLISILVIGEATQLPLAEVLDVISRDRSLARLRSATRLFQNMRMVG